MADLILKAERMTAPKIENVHASVGAKIKLIREALGWTQGDLAEKVGLARTSITNIELGNQRMLLDDVERFAAAFQSTPKQLLKGIWF